MFLEITFKANNLVLNVYRKYIKNRIWYPMYIEITLKTKNLVFNVKRKYIKN